VKGARQDAARVGERLVLDARTPLDLTISDQVYRVLSGAVDIFAIPTGRARRHLFRIESGGLALGLALGGAANVRTAFLAVGVQGSEVQCIDRAQLEDTAALEPWLIALGSASGVAATPLGEDATATEPWARIDALQARAAARIDERLAREAETESARLRHRQGSDATQREQLFGALARIVVPGADATRPVLPVGGDTLFAACRIVVEAMGVRLEPQSARPLDRQDFQPVAEFARASNLRVRKTLLRRGWRDQDVGPLVAWLGEARRPVAILPAPGRGYDLVHPDTGQRQPLDDAVAEMLSAEAAAFYRPLPAGLLSARRLLGWISRQVRADLSRVVLSAMTLALLGLAAPVITAVLVDQAIPRSDASALAFCAAALGVAAITAAGFQAIEGVAIQRLGGAGDWVLQAAVMDRLLRLPAAFFTRYTAGDLADRVLGVDEIRRLLTGRAVGGLLSGAFCLFGLALMFAFDARLAWVAGAFILVQGGVIVAVSAARLGRERRYFDAQGRAQGLVLQMLTGVGKLRAADAATRAFGLWVRTFSEQKGYFIASQRQAIRLTTFEAVFPVLANLTVFALALTTSGPSIDAGRFLAFFAAFGQALAAVAGLGAAVGEILVAAPFFDRLRPILDEPLELGDGRESPGEISGALEVSQVSFRYTASGPPVIDRLSLQVGQGEFVAVVGPSGGGKSTLFRLLLGFEQPQSGAILFDGRPVESLDLGALRRQIGVVLQNGKLTSGSLYDNICGAVRVPVEQVWQAVRQAGLEADIEAMPMGLHTIITEGVSALSGGQRQRLMIARALVHQPRLLLFDEATSALDNRTQSLVSDALAKLNVTRIIIAHRLSTVRDADRIVVVAGGAVVQSGRFETLSREPGLFADLARRQLA
jgi:NHLM bacteriocin system ABC transporter ATP-binding protein